MNILVLDTFSHCTFVSYLHDVMVLQGEIMVLNQVLVRLCSVVVVFVML